jgi:lipoic acid synthetase
MTTLSLNELSRRERRRLGLPDSLDLLPVSSPSNEPTDRSCPRSGRALLAPWRGPWDNDRYCPNRWSIEPMTDAARIPIAVRSGDKVRKPQGFTAIRDGIKARAGTQPEPIGRKPSWLRARLPSGGKYEQVKRNVKTHRLATVCEESKCPNIGECWTNGVATIMLMGDVCTRACRFCSVDTGNPRGWLDPEEPDNSAESVRLMDLKYVVLTSVDRDDLADGGAGHYADCVRAIKRVNPDTAVEALTPDFQGRLHDVEVVIDSGLDVFAQNVETVRRLTHPVRDPRAGYQQTLGVLAHAKRHRPAVLTKTSLMLGLGETFDEVVETMDDLRAIGVDILTFGQYLRPTVNHLPVDRFVPPEEFRRLREIGLEKGFLEVVSGPLVRSSYRADRVFEKNNCGIDENAA